MKTIEKKSQNSSRKEKIIIYWIVPLLGIYFVGSLLSLNLNPLKWGDELQRNYNERKQTEQRKKFVFDYVDENKDGKLSNKENCNIMYLMAIEDSLTTYHPTQKDWDKAYQNIQTGKRAQIDVLKELNSNKEN